MLVVEREKGLNTFLSTASHNSSTGNLEPASQMHPMQTTNHEFEKDVTKKLVQRHELNAAIVFSNKDDRITN